MSLIHSRNLRVTKPLGLPDISSAPARDLEVQTSPANTSTEPKCGGYFSINRLGSHLLDKLLVLSRLITSRHGTQRYT
jgi:hypothetical protein